MLSFDKERILTYLKLSFFQTILFVTIYGATNWLAAQHSYHWQLWHPAELIIPFIPSMILGYVSLNVLMIVPMFSLSVDQLHGLNKAMTWATILAGLCFLLIPAPIGFIRGEVSGTWSEFYKTLYSLDKSANTFPSLHIAFSFLFIRILMSALKRYYLFFSVWFLIIAFSVLLTHQHHLIDIVGGMILAEFCFRRFYLREING